MGWLWIGDARDASNTAFMHAPRSRIGAVVNCAGVSDRGITQDVHRRPLPYLQLDARDDSTEQLARHRARVAVFLDAVKAAGLMALVHCHAGMNRSVAIALDYVSSRYPRVSLEALVSTIAQHRPCLTNRAFIHQLCARKI
jgi:protein-tyrosine phosphatase